MSGNMTGGNMTCGEFEILLADFLDGSLHAAQKTAFDYHRSSCAACAELAHDASGAMVFIERVAEVAPPPVLVNRILLEGSRGGVKTSWAQRWAGAPLHVWLGRVWPGRVLQPRFAMSMAMAMLSLALLGRFGAAAENGVHRAWDRTLKNYDNLALVYDVQTQLQEWRQAPDADQK